MLGLGPDTAAPSGADPARLAAEGIRAAQLSTLLLLAVAAVQLVAVVFSGSVALLSDTIHNFVDALSGLPVWLALALGLRRPSRRFSYGLHRAEELAGLVVVILIVFSAGAAGYESVRRLVSEPGALESVPVGLAGGLFGLAGNHVAAIYRIRVGRRIGSTALVADGYHARADALTSLAAVIGITGAALGFHRADPIAGLFVVAVIILALVREVLPGVGGRLLEGVEPELIDRVESAAQTTPGIGSLGPIRARWVGRRLNVEMNIVVAGRLTVAESHTIAADLEHRVLHDVPEVAEVIVHVDPDDPRAHDHLVRHR